MRIPPHVDFVNCNVTNDMSGARSAVEIFGERLRSAREARGFNQRELSDRLGVPASSIAHFEGGRRKPSFDNLSRLARALDVTTDYLLGHSDEPQTPSTADPLVRGLAKLDDRDREVVAAVLNVLIGQKRGRRSASQ